MDGEQRENGGEVTFSPDTLKSGKLRIYLFVLASIYSLVMCVHLATCTLGHWGALTPSSFASKDSSQPTGTPFACMNRERIRSTRKTFLLLCIQEYKNPSSMASESDSPEVWRNPELPGGSDHSCPLLHLRPSSGALLACSLTGLHFLHKSLAPFWGINIKTIG